MSKRATRRPAPFRKPAHWTDDRAPRPAGAVVDEQGEELSPTRYGDWVRNGLAVDF